MKSKRLLLVLLLALFVPWAAIAQTTVEIGDGTSTGYYTPIGTYYNYSITEQLYTAEEIGMAGTIESVSFYWAYTTAKDFNITMYMANVDAANLSTGISLADADEVFSGTLSVPATAGWVTITLDTPFEYDGRSNLLIGFNKTGGANWFSGSTWQYTSASNMARYTQNDNSAYDITSTIPGTVTNNRPNIQIVITPTGGGPTCTKPSTLEVTDIAGYTATCTWENTGAASYTFEWKKTSDSNYTVIAGLTANSYNMRGLEPMTAYTVRVKAVCDTDLESGYKSANFTTLDVCPDGKVCIGEGTTTNNYLPTYIYYNYSLTQQIYTAEEIGEAALIESVDIYSVGSVTRNLEIYMVSTEKTTFESATDWIPATGSDLVFSGQVAFAANSWNTMEFSSPFIYNGRNNVVLIVRDVTGSYVSSINFFVFDAEGNQAIYAYRDTPGAYDITAPGVSGTLLGVKNRVRFGVSELPSCLQPSGLTVSEVEARQAVLSWTENGEATAWEVEVTGDYTTTWDATTNPYTLVGLEPETEYSVRVRANCGDGDYSEWSAAVTFTTDQACHTPTGLHANDVTARTALINWSGVENTFDLRYAIIPQDRESYSSYTFADFVNRSSTDLTNLQITSNPNAEPNTNMGAEQLRNGWYYYDNNVYNTSFGASGSMYWAVMYPAGTFSENLLTKIAVYENDNNSQPITVYVCTGDNAPDQILYTEEFEVEAANAFHEVTLATPVTVDPSQNLWLVLYATDNYPAAVCYDDNLDEANARWCSFDASTWYDLANVGGATGYAWMIRAYLEAFVPGDLDWTYVYGIEDFEYELTNLVPETDYVTQVRANCGNENGESAWASTFFTTLPTCLTPSDLYLTDITAHTAEIGWTENGDATAWQICLNDDEENPIDVTENPFILTGLSDYTRYTVKVRANCGDGDFSDWTSAVIFITDIACYGPTGLTVNNIMPTSALINWQSSAESCELRYSETNGGWMVYDDGQYATNIGSSAANERTWAVMYPAEMLGQNQVLSMISMYENYRIESDITINIYQGGDTVPETLLYTEVVAPLPVRNGVFQYVELAEPVTINPTQNLWISLTATGPYVMPACLSNMRNNRWVYDSTNGWQQLTSSLSDYGWMIRAYLGTLDWITIADITGNEYTMSDLLTETNYTVQVRSNCDEEGYSWWESTNFTTLDACDAPNNLAAIDNLTTAYTATLNWIGYQDSYNLRYGVEGEPTAFYHEDFENQVIPDGFVNGETGWEIWNDTVAGTYCIASSNYNVSSSTATISMNATFDEPGTIEFYSRVSSEGGSWDYGYFSIDGTQQYSEGGTTPNTWTQRTFEVGAGTHTFTWSYRKDSSVNSGEDRYFIDNIVLSLSNINWIETIEGITEAPYTLTGLERTTEYFAQVQGVCNSGLTEWSNLASFTTTISCWQPTQLVATDVMADYAILDWTANGEETAWEIEVSDDQEPPVVTNWTATEKPFTLAGLFPETEYSVRVRANCGEFDGYSEWSDAVSFTTLGYCDIPEDLEVGNITFYNATASWNGIQNSYNLKYWKYEVDAIVSENFNSGIPADWANDTIYPWTVTNGYIQSGNAGVSSSTSAISVTVTYEQDGVIEFDAECRGEGSSTYYDHCDFAIDGNTVFYHGADLTNEGWLHYSFEVEAGEHTFTWSYSKDSSVNPTGDYFAIDNVAIGYAVTTEYPIVENIQDNSYLFTDLEYDATYFVQVQGMDENCTAGTEWTDAVSFFFPMPTQTIALEAGANWCSFNVEITLNDLKAALVAAAAGSDINVITIKSQTQVAQYNPNNGRWTGRLTSLDLSKMYKITIGPSGTACEITLQGYVVDPADHPVTISQGVNWIAFPLNTEMTISAAFAGFPVNGDIVKSQQQNASYNRGRWMGQLSTLQPGKGYVYKSAATSTKTFTFPIPTNK